MILCNSEDDFCMLAKYGATEQFVTVKCHSVVEDSLFPSRSDSLQKLAEHL